MDRGTCQLQDRLQSQRGIISDDTVFTDKVTDWGGEHGVAARDFPVLLQHNRKGQSMLPDLRPVFFWFAFADHHHFQFGVLAMELFEFGRQRVAGTTARAGEDQQDCPPAQLAQRKLAASVQSRETEIRSRCAGSQTITSDLASRQRATAESTCSSRGNEALIIAMAVVA